MSAGARANAQEQPPEPDLARRAGGRHRVAEPHRRAVDDDANRHERAAVRRGDLRHRVAFHVDGDRTGSRVPRALAAAPSSIACDAGEQRAVPRPAERGSSAVSRVALTTMRAAIAIAAPSPPTTARGRQIAPADERRIEAPAMPQLTSALGAGLDQSRRAPRRGAASHPAHRHAACRRRGHQRCQRGAQPPDPVCAPPLERQRRRRPATVNGWFRPGSAFDRRPGPTAGSRPAIAVVLR